MTLKYQLRNLKCFRVEKDMFDDAMLWNLSNIVLRRGFGMNGRALFVTSSCRSLIDVLVGFLKMS